MEDNNFLPRAVLITGAARGIGMAIARELDGYFDTLILDDAGVTINGEIEDPTLIYKEIKKYNWKSNIISTNILLNSYESAREIYNLAIENKKTVDILINNAAVLNDKMVFNMTENQWQEVLNSNLNGHFFLTSMISKDFRKNLYGRIINIISSSGLIGDYGQSNYAASKGALFSLTRVWALELAKYGVTVNAIAPFGHTRVTDTIPQDKPWLKDYLEKAKIADPSSIGKLCKFLTSSDSRYITGQLFGIRGNEFYIFSQPRIADIVKGEITQDLFNSAIKKWEDLGLLYPLESDLMYMSKIER